MALLRVIVVMLAALAGLKSVAAQDGLYGVPAAGYLDIVDEVRVGGHFHNVYWTMVPQNFGNWNWTQPADVSFDVLFKTPDMDVFRWLGSPRPEVGATLSLTGYEHLLHAGLTWQLPVFDTPFYLEGTFGAAAHNGYLTGAPPGFKNFGCRVNFYERFGIGANVTENATVTLTYEHTSNAGLCPANNGLSNVGLRFGMKF